MAMSKTIFVKAFIVTLFIFVSVYSLNLYLNYERERAVDEKMNEVVDEFEEFQALTSLLTVYGSNATCMTLNSRMRLLDIKIWQMGGKIEAYRQLSREYMTDPYYQTMKQKFNRQQVIYFSLLKEMKQKCAYDQTEILFFYKKSEDCPSCDDQSYVLNYFNQLIDKEIAVFSFDANLDLPSVDVLEGIYNITSYPCVVVEDVPYQGLRDREEMKSILCNASSGRLSVCRDNTQKLQ